MSDGKRQVCVIGAGLSGLCAVRHCIEQGMEVVAYEQAHKIGGVWLYSDRVAQESAALEQLPTSLYENLRTNLPKEVMCYPDFPFPDKCKESFVTAQQVLRYLELYADVHKLHPYIKLENEVVNVKPHNDGWQVVVHDLTKDSTTIKNFDFVFVCNGNYEKRVIPEIDGMNLFQGQQMHSQVYRKADAFKDGRVLIIGCGPSGLDIAQQLQFTAAHIYLSHHSTRLPNISALQNLTQKPDVERLTETGAVFKDGTTAEISHVIYCTGYQYSFPFISTDAGFHVTNHWVKPLWKHCIVINNPTMALIDIPLIAIPAIVSDLQVRFALKYFTGERHLPSKEEMLKDMEHEMDIRLQKGWSTKAAHNMADLQLDYYADLAATAGIEPPKPVLVNIMRDCLRSYLHDYVDYRRHCFKVIDDENFIKSPLE